MNDYGNINGVPVVCGPQGYLERVWKDALLSENRGPATPQWAAGPDGRPALLLWNLPARVSRRILYRLRGRKDVALYARAITNTSAPGEWISYAQAPDKPVETRKFPYPPRRNP